MSQNKEVRQNSDKSHEEKRPVAEGSPAPEEKVVETQHTATVNGREIHYTVTTGTLILKYEEEKEGKSEGEKARAALFFVAYTLDGEHRREERPLTFSFNGGPGSSSVWLHLGLLGPRRVLMDEIGNPLPPPYKLVNNDHSLLDVTDLVFIDPISTGYSRVVAGEKARDFHTFSKDIESVGDFIRLYLTRSQRWPSPKFLIGESYGTTRAGGLSGYLQERHGIFLNGIMLISSVLNFMTLDFSHGNDLPFILFLPTYAATAWYHGRLSTRLQADLQQTLREVADFALNDYTLALMKGAALSEAERQAVIARLAEYTGLAPEYIGRTNLRLNIYRFVKELLREQRRTVGRLDSRFTGIDRDAAGETAALDPSYSNIQGPYTATLNDYIRRDLKFESDLAYEILTERVHPWNYDRHQNEYVNVAETLRQSICMNAHLKVFVANGYFDLATPYLATEYTFNHLNLEPELQPNISMSYYEAGHMMYIHMPSLVQLKQDLAQFIETAISR
jgi:carboxypeptidase C (cathepsin A)